MRVLGIDPGLQVTGYGLLEADGDRPRVIEAGVIRSDSREPIEARLRDIAGEIDGILRQFSPDAMAIEELYSHYDHPITAVVMGHVRGVILLRASENNIPIISYAPTRIKKSLTGNGRASKEQMQLMIKSTLKLQAVPDPPDAADALAVALCHCQAILHHSMVEV